MGVGSRKQQASNRRFRSTIMTSTWAVLFRARSLSNLISLQIASLPARSRRVPAVTESRHTQSEHALPRRQPISTARASVNSSPCATRAGSPRGRGRVPGRASGRLPPIVPLHAICVAMVRLPCRGWSAYRRRTPPLWRRSSSSASPGQSSTALRDPSLVSCTSLAQLTQASTPSRPS